VALTFVVFIPCLSKDFVNWDDDINVHENQNLKAFDWAHVNAFSAATSSEVTIRLPSGRLPSRNISLD
jgi:hypothetical protein